jgi:hypothetical protein
MPQLVALSLSIAVLGGIWAWICLGTSIGLIVWAGFIAWGCYFHTGGDNKALIKTICGNVYGVIIAWIALLIVANVPIAALGALWPAIVIGATVFLLVIVASIEQLSVVPANVYGYAATAAYGVSGGGIANVTAANMTNPLIGVGVSMVIGAVLGMVSGRVAGMLTKKAAATA